jgi:hypothetical protein
MRISNLEFHIRQREKPSKKYANDFLVAEAATVRGERGFCQNASSLSCGRDRETSFGDAPRKIKSPASRPGFTSKRRTRITSPEP